MLAFYHHISVLVSFCLLFAILFCFTCSINPNSLQKKKKKSFVPYIFALSKSGPRGIACSLLGRFPCFLLPSPPVIGCIGLKNPPRGCFGSDHILIMILHETSLVLGPITPDLENFLFETISVIDYDTLDTPIKGLVTAFYSDVSDDAFYTVIAKAVVHCASGIRLRTFHLFFFFYLYEI